MRYLRVAAVLALIFAAWASLQLATSGEYKPNALIYGLLWAIPLGAFWLAAKIKPQDRF